MTRNPEIGKQAKVILAGSILSAAVGISFSQLSPAEQTTAHPYVAPDDIKSDTCLTCHPDKKEGKAVHTAVRMGCENCHHATSEREEESTTITPIAEGAELCAMCHKTQKDSVIHGPYKAGQCLVCHNPHASDFPRQMRAGTNTLCMSCHGISRPDVKINTDARTVSLLGGRTIDLASYEKAPKIGSEHYEKSTPRVVSHPGPAKELRKPGAELDCISCHDPHASKAEHLLRKATESRDPTASLWLGLRADFNAQVQKPDRHAVVELRPSGYADLRAGFHPIVGLALGDIRAFWPRHRRPSLYLRTHFIGGQQ